MYSPTDSYPFDYEEPDSPTVYRSEDGKVALVIDSDGIRTTYTVRYEDKQVMTEDGMMPDTATYYGGEPLSTFLDLPMLYREDKQERLEFDAPRAYRQRPATDADRDDEDRAQTISTDGWINDHLEIVDAEEDATIADLFEVE